MWQFRFIRSCELNRITESTVQAHMNWRCWSVPFVRTEPIDQFIWVELQMRWPYQNIQLNELKFLKSSNQLKWTGQQVQFRWKELGNISSSHERQSFDQSQFNELRWNCHMSCCNHITNVYHSHIIQVWGWRWGIMRKQFEVGIKIMPLLHTHML